MAEGNDFGPGWALPVLGVGTRGGKAHYYTAGFRGASLCGKYALLGGQREDHTHDSPDNCAECTRRYFAKHPELELPRRLRRVRVELTEEVRHPEYDYVCASAGARGAVRGMDARQLEAQASRGGSVDVEITKPRRTRLFVKAAILRALA